MTFARRTLIHSFFACMWGASAAASAAQQPDDATPAQVPAPILRRTPKPPVPTTESTTTPPAPVKVTPRPSAGRPGANTAPTASAKPPAPAPQPAPAGPFNRTTIVLDPAHGGGDTGSRISDSVTEKDVTLALAFRLRSLLNARGFTTVLTRESDDASSAPGSPLTLDDRAGLANRARPLACLLLHATASGSGVHLYSSELASTPGELVPAPWLTAQAPWVTQSQHLATQIATALSRAKIPLVNNRASVRPVDSLTCPALVVELGPGTAGDTATLTDGGYQQRVAEAITGAMVFWQNQAQPPARLLPPPPPAPSTPVATLPSQPSEAKP